MANHMYQESRYAWIPNRLESTRRLESTNMSTGLLVIWGHRFVWQSIREQRDGDPSREVDTAGCLDFTSTLALRG